ncbi:hypothetical protein [Kordiimonas aquimaris]|uniref:hypothetical protein n=1 Tax=Kordiimonas aquimaris TaxID=707591 RepID=UPI0021D2A0E0|nr:hypothetical protein [Kordiimonas aquimaris]
MINEVTAFEHLSMMTMKTTLLASKTKIVALTLLGSCFVSFSGYAASSSNVPVVASASMIAPGSLGLGRTPSNVDVASPFLSTPNQSGFDAALTFVKKTGLNKNLSLLLLETMKRDRLVLSAIRAKGLKAVQGIVVNAIILEREQHKSAWEHILATTYSKFFRAAELESLAVEKEKSPYFARLISIQNEITTQVNTQGSSILETAERNVKARIAADLGA